MTFDAENTIATRFENAVLCRPDHPAVVLADTELSYAMMLNLAKSFALKLAQRGVGPGSTLQLETRDLPVVLASLLASAALGARLAEGSITPQLSGPFPVTHRLFTSDTDIENAVIIDETWSPALVLAGAPAQALTQGVDIDVPWLILATSGTTGFPKVVGLSQRQVLRRSLAVSDEFSPETRFAALFPVDCRPFFARALAALLNGATIVERGSWEFWLEKGVNRLSGSLKQVKGLEVTSYSAQKIPVLEVSGAKITSKDALDLLQHFDQVDDTYGATETSKSFSNILTLDDTGALRRRGAPRDSVVDILGPDGTVLPALQVGEVRVRNAYLATEYIFNSKGALTVLKDGAFFPGDIGSFTQDGALDILSRSGADLLNFDGIKLNAAVVDAVLASVDGILGAAALQSPKSNTNDVVAFAEFAPETNQMQTAELARKACSDAFGSSIMPQRIWPINKIPRKADGSPDREECATLLRQAIAAAQRP